MALGYALLVFLISPALLSADEEPAPPEPVATVEDSATTVQDALPEVPGLPVGASRESDEPDAEAQPQPKAEPQPKAASAKTDDKSRENPRKDPVARSSSSATVTISDFKFTPDTVTVNEGDTITWNNDGPTPHTASAEDGSFDTGILRKGESGSATFTQAGTISYICQPHPYMHGKVIVQAATSTGSGSGSGSSGGGTDTGSSDDSGGAVAGDETSSSSSSGLPNTGFEGLSIALLGIATLGVGVLLRRREQS